MDIKKAETLFSDPQFVKLAKDKVNDAKALEDLFKEKGLEINPDDLTFLTNFINKHPEYTNQELTDNQLTDVAGGLSDGVKVAGGVAAGIAATTAFGAALYGEWKLYQKGKKDGKKEVMDEIKAIKRL